MAYKGLASVFDMDPTVASTVSAEVFSATTPRPDLEYYVGISYIYDYAGHTTLSGIEKTGNLHDYTPASAQIIHVYGNSKRFKPILKKQ